MAMLKNTSNFFTDGTSEQFQHVMNLYTEVLKLKAESKNKKPEELIKLDNWYQNELPKKIKSRAKDAHINHEELVQLMKWKQTRGKFYPQLNYLVKVNTPRAVMLETKKAFKKLPNLESAITALSNLKGVGTTLASALLAAANPELAPFMADECLMAIPDIEGIDYTTKEYLKFVNLINSTVERLNKQTKNSTWNAHKVELALWTHYVACELKPELLDDLPNSNTNGTTTHTNGDTTQGIDTCSDESNLEPASHDKTNKTSNPVMSEVEDTSSLQSLPSEDNSSIGNNHNEEITNDSIMTESDTNTNDNVPISTTSDITPSNDVHSNAVVADAIDDNASEEPPLKKTKFENGVDKEAEMNEVEKVEENNTGKIVEDSIKENNIKEAPSPTSTPSVESKVEQIPKENGTTEPEPISAE